MNIIFWIVGVVVITAYCVKRYRRAMREIDAELARMFRDKAQ